MIEVLTCHFNPCGYKKPLENYWAFRRHMQTFDVNLRTIEMTFDEQQPQISDAVQVHGRRENQMLWQKERLLNLLIANSTAKVVAWIDADVWFMNPRWVERAEDYLLDEGGKVLQLFSEARMINECGVASDNVWKSFAMMRSTEVPRWYDCSISHSGLAWAANGDWLREHLLYDKIASGINDSVMALYFCGDQARAETTLNPEMTANFRAWAPPLDRALEVSFAVGTVLHMFHGTNKNRNRRKQREEHGRQRPRDLIIRNGAYQWSDIADKEMVEEIRQRFVNRQEDS
jgi:glycosyltransferase involved in cell wall biosynthesis